MPTEQPIQHYRYLVLHTLAIGAYVSDRHLRHASSPSRKVTEMTVMEMISFLQNDNKMKIKMKGVNHVESPIITAVYSLLIL